MFDALPVQCSGKLGCDGHIYVVFMLKCATEHHPDGQTISGTSSKLQTVNKQLLFNQTH